VKLRTVARQEFTGVDAERLIQFPAVAINQHAEITSKDFEALAWEAANAKARELGWMA
jgi:hypothetical protein